jgi:hypothetical protein
VQREFAIPTLTGGSLAFAALELDEPVLDLDLLELNGHDGVPSPTPFMD